MYYKFKIILYETGLPLYTVAKLKSDMYQIAAREGWRDKNGVYLMYTDTNPLEEE